MNLKQRKTKKNARTSMNPPYIELVSIQQYLLFFILAT